MVERLEKIRLRYGEDETRLRKNEGGKESIYGFHHPETHTVELSKPCFIA